MTLNVLNATVRLLLKSLIGTFSQSLRGLTYSSPCPSNGFRGNGSLTGTYLTLKAFKLLYYILAFIINTLKDFSNSLVPQLAIISFLLTFLLFLFLLLPLLLVPQQHSLTSFRLSLPLILLQLL